MFKGQLYTCEVRGFILLHDFHVYFFCIFPKCLYIHKLYFRDILCDTIWKCPFETCLFIQHYISEFYRDWQFILFSCCILSYFVKIPTEGWFGWFFFVFFITFYTVIASFAEIILLLSLCFYVQKHALDWHLEVEF